MTEKKKLLGLNYSEYEHPQDRDALNALDAIPGVQSVGKKIIEKYLDKQLYLNTIGSSIEITRDNDSRLHGLLSSCCAILDIHEVPPLYISDDQSGGWAATNCVNQPLIVIGQNLLERCNDEEIMFVLGHELGHIKSAHLLYHVMAGQFHQIQNIASEATLGLPLAKLLSAGLEIALNHWYRMSEFTSDRAGLLCCQNITSCIDLFIKLGDFPSGDCSSIPYLKIEKFRESFIKQSQDFKNFEDAGPIAKFIRMDLTRNQSHPWLILRGSELLDWHDSGEYEQILNNEDRNFTSKVANSAKFCPNCGASIQGDSKFCGGCGTIIES